MKPERGEFGGFWKQLEPIIKARPSTANVFNQYRDFNAEVDLPAAPSIRSSNLRKYWKKRCPPPQFSLLARQLSVGNPLLGCAFHWGETTPRPFLPIFGPTVEPKRSPACDQDMPPYISNTAGMFLGNHRPFYAEFVAWNAIPLHPHKPGDYLTVRNPGKAEVSQCREARESLRLIMNT